ncbi:hypothetical protein Alexa_048 [Acinetobacter phage vB_AbaP_Alexa]|nr:hypothetical protein Alexa_048 [Acinetobacter phage vB_AbaP_Alexa]
MSIKPRLPQNAIYAIVAYAKGYHVVSKAKANGSWFDIVEFADFDFVDGHEFKILEPVQNEASKTEPETSNIAEIAILNKLDWSIQNNLWRWVKASELMDELGLCSKNRGDQVVKFGKIVGSHHRIKRRRYQGFNQILVPPLKKHEPESTDLF